MHTRFLGSLLFTKSLVELKKTDVGSYTTDFSISSVVILEQKFIC